MQHFGSSARDELVAVFDTANGALLGLVAGSALGPLRTGAIGGVAIDSLARLYLAHPDAVLVAGATDVGLWITKQLRQLPKIIHLGRVAELAGVRVSDQGCHIGAGASYEMAEVALAAIDPDLGEVLRRLGAKQVRAAGTVGGNIANGSPIGDMPPAPF